MPAAAGKRRRQRSLLAPAPAAPAENARNRELHELHREKTAGDTANRDLHSVWEDDDGRWWTDYPPRPGFAGEQEREYGEEDYRRTLAPDEQAVIDAECEVEDAEERVIAEAQRRNFFGEEPAEKNAGEQTGPAPDTRVSGEAGSS